LVTASFASVCNIRRSILEKLCRSRFERVTEPLIPFELPVNAFDANRLLKK